MKKTCTQCQSPFEVTDEDLAFYDKVSPVFNGKKYAIPPPTLCPDCRWQRRISFRNERSLYKRTCDLTGQSIFSMYPPDTPFPVYEVSQWKTDAWDPRDFGRDFDFSRPFFEQFAELMQIVPRPSRWGDPSLDQNSDYTNCAGWNKNCYLITQAAYNEDCYYSRSINYCKDSCDCFGVHKCERCYECVDLNNCYNCIECQQCDNCHDCSLSTSLRGCKHCFGCHGLTQKEYCLFNEQLDKAKWERHIEELKKQPWQKLRECSAEISKDTPKKALNIIQCENSVGDHIEQCRNCYAVFNCINLENCKYCYAVNTEATKDCMDYSMWGGAELLYECNGCGTDAYHLLFCDSCFISPSELLYCTVCMPAVKNCFGCVCMKRLEYCILNKQYTKEEYEELVPKLITHMQSTEEWGEFFPATIDPFAYNETIAYEYLPLSKEEMEERGWRWREKSDEVQNVTKTIPASRLPNTIDTVPDDILNWAIICEATERPFKIIKQELGFYRSMKLPIPHLHPDERHKRRMALRNPRKLWDRQCDKCSKDIQTTYSPDRPETVYCEECYLKEVY